jgi:FkbM family methyltransferase
VNKLIKKLARQFGVELKRFNPSTSEICRMQYLFAYHQIDCVLDIGANIGQYAKSLRELGYRGKIVSFEPLPQAYDRLKKNSEKDVLWEVAPRTAIGDKDGEIEINISGNSEASSVLNILDSHLKMSSDFAYVSSETVKLNKLDTIAKSYVKEANSIYLKIDVQGYELQVLEGASQILPKVSGIQLELSLTPLYDNQPLWNETLEKMKHLDYELYAIVPVFTDMKTGKLLQMDGIFCKKI